MPQTVTSASLADQLAALSAKSPLPPAAGEIMRRTVAHVARFAPGLPAGEPAPDFELPDQLGRTVSLRDLRAAGPVVAVFYRGDWCPYCNLTLRAMDAQLERISALGASLVAISPQAPDRSLAMTEKHALRFPVLSDLAQETIAAYRLGFDTPAEQQRMVRSALWLDLSRENADGTWRLPASATYVIDSDATIVAAGVTANPRERMEPEAVVATLGLLV